MPPSLVVEIPEHGLAQALLEASSRAPAEVFGNPGGVRGVPEVMAGPILHHPDQASARPTGNQGRRHLVKHVADRFDYGGIRTLGISADHVGVAWPAVLQDLEDRLGVVVDE